MASKISSDEKEKILQSLTRVGDSKAIGYLPLYTIRDFLEMTAQELSEQARHRGLDALCFEEDRCLIKSGALYLYDRDRLNKILAASTHILKLHQWPTDPDLFVGAIAQEWLQPGNPILPIVKQAFGEQAAKEEK